MSLGWMPRHDQPQSAGMQLECVTAMRPKRRERGNAYIEFVLVASFIIVPITLGLVTVGIAVLRNFQVNQLTRDVGHMMANGVDFSKQANQNLVVNDLANGLSLQANSGNATGNSTGNGVLVLSIFEQLPNSCNCTNAGHTVVVRRIVIGNSTLWSSPFGNPSSIDSASGEIANYATDTTARADNLSNVISLSTGGLAYMAEGDFAFKDLGIVGFIANLGAFNRAVF